MSTPDPTTTTSQEFVMSEAPVTTAVAQFDGSAGSMPVITGGHLPAFMEWSKAIAVGSVIPDALRGKPADVLITVLHGLDLGLRPMQALNLVYVVKGRPSLSAEGMRALLQRDGHEFETVESSDTKAVVRGRRKGTEKWHEASFTIEQAKKAKLAGDNWEKYAEDMLFARATSRLCKRHFSDVTGGLPSVEELTDSAPAAPVLSLAQAVAQRESKVDTSTGEIIDAEVVDEVAEAAEAERLRQTVASIEDQFINGPAYDEPTTDDAQEPSSGWTDVEVAKPGGGAK